jgi:hypothetical protein
VDNVKSRAFSPTAGGSAAAKGSTVANTSKGVNMRFNGITSLLDRISAKLGPY